MRYITVSASGVVISIASHLNTLSCSTWDDLIKIYSVLSWVDGDNLRVSTSAQDKKKAWQQIADALCKRWWLAF